MRISKLNLVFALSLSSVTSVFADTMIRFKCIDDNEGAEVFINKKLVGKCPLDASARAGSAEIVAKKKDDSGNERIFTTKIDVIENAPQRVTIQLSSPSVVQTPINTGTPTVKSSPPLANTQPVVNAPVYNSTQAVAPQPVIQGQTLTTNYSPEINSIISAVKAGRGLPDNSIVLKLPEKGENGAVIPIEVSSNRTFTPGEKLYLIIDNKYLSGILTPTDFKTPIFFNLRARVFAETKDVTSNIKVVLIDASGQMRFADRNLFVQYPVSMSHFTWLRGKEGGCEVNSKMRAVQSESSLEIKYLASCRQDPEIYIKNVEFYDGGNKLANIELTPDGTVKNPFIGIKVMRGSSGYVTAKSYLSNGSSYESQTPY